MGVARDIGFRMPSIWFAEGHRAVAPVYLYRFDLATPMLRAAAPAAPPTPPNCPTSGAISSPGRKDPTFKLGGLQGGRGGVGSGCGPGGRTSRRTANRPGRRANRSGGPTAADDRATLVIDKQDAVVDDLDRDVRAAWGDDVLSFR